MAFGLHKPGQGYWVRVMTATLAGVLILAAAAWLWRTLAAIDPPTPTWVVTVSPASGQAAAGQVVALFGEGTEESAPRLGTATVASVESVPPNSVRLRIEKIDVGPDRTAASTRRIAPEEGSAATLSGPLRGLPQGEPLFERLYIQASGAGVVLLGGAILLYWLVGVRTNTAEFLIATDGEMKKVNWSTRKHIFDSTWVVILWSVLLAAGLFAVDAVFSSFFKLIGVLEQ